MHTNINLKFICCLLEIYIVYNNIELFGHEDDVFVADTSERF